MAASSLRPAWPRGTRSLQTWHQIYRRQQQPLRAWHQIYRKQRPQQQLAGSLEIPLEIALDQFRLAARTLPRKPKPPSEPLRILFCGSDHFSCASLQALYDEHLRNPSLIASIDVLVRPGKKAGRGLKRIAVGPLFELATRLRLPLHQRDTFTGWALPLPGVVRHHATERAVTETTGTASWLPRDEGTGKVVHGAWRAAVDAARGQPRPFNLVVAVSFGLFVPPRILRAVKYGGLNVHPSMLPDLRGAAPLQHTLLRRRAHTGASLQTLHEKNFDRGKVLVQTPWPGLPVPEGCTTRELHDIVAPVGAELLVQGLRDRVHVPPLEEVGWQPKTECERQWLRDAPKITKLDGKIDWGSISWGADESLYPEGWTATDLVRRLRVLGSLWSHGMTVKHPAELRIIWEDAEAIRCPDNLRDIVHAVVQNRVGWDRVDPQLRKQIEEDVAGKVKGIHNITWTMKNHETHESKLFRFPLVNDPDGESIIIPIRVPYTVADGNVDMVFGRETLDALRIKLVKVEGQNSRPPVQSLKPFAEKDLVFSDLLSLDYAVNTMTKLVE